MTFQMPRRNFMTGCCAGIMAMCGSRVSNLVFAQGDAPGKVSRGGQQDTLVVVWLRGGMDVLSFIVPYSNTDYQTARARLKLSGSQVHQFNANYGLHRSALLLKTLSNEKQLGFVVAAGSTDASRSHFDAMKMIEHGTPGSPNSSGGWLTRHLDMFPNNNVFQAVSQGSSIAASLDAYSGAVAMQGVGDFTINSPSAYSADMRRALRRMYAADPDLTSAANATLDAIDQVEYADPNNYVPGNGVVYPNTGFSNSMKSIAQLIRLDLGLQAATVDLGGWDTHETQADNGNPQSGRYANLVTELSGGMDAFWRDLTPYHGRLTVVVMTEFGRRLKENDNRGTDHGHGGMMMVMSANLAHGGLFGTFPGLSHDELFENVDLAVTTDFRQVLGETLVERMGNTNIDQVFPGYTYPGPLGIFEPSPRGNGLIVR